jgi:hypothetical protein
MACGFFMVATSKLLAKNLEVAIFLRAVQPEPGRRGKVGMNQQAMA